MANPFADATSGVVYGATGTTYYDNVMTNYFLQAFPDAKNNGSVLLGMLERVPSVTVDGKFVVFPVSFGRNTGLQNLGFSDGTVRPAIPVAGRQSYATMSTFSRQGMGTIDIDGEILRNAKVNGGAYADATQLEMSKFMDDVRIDRARQVHNDGSGRLAEVASVSTTTITLKVNQSIEGAANTKGAGTLDQTGWFDVGQRIAFITNDGTPTPITIDATQEGVYVTAIAVSGNNVTIQVALTPGGSAVDVSAELTAGDWIVRAADTALSTNYRSTSWRSELTGFGGIMSDANIFDGVGTSSASQQGSFSMTSATAASFQGIAVSGNAWNQAVVLDNGGAGNRPISIDLMQQSVSDAEKANNADIEFGMMSYETYNSYLSLIQPDKRYVNTLDLPTGHKTLSFNGIPLFKDRFCYQNRVLWLGLQGIQMLETQPMRSLSMMEGMASWERVITTDGRPIDKYWRGWVWQDQIALTGTVRQRVGAILCELSA